MKFLRLQPLVSLAWSVTDEFGNFHYTHNPDGLTELPAFALNGLLYSEDDLDELAADLRAFIRQSRWGGCGVLPFGRCSGQDRRLQRSVLRQR